MIEVIKNIIKTEGRYVNDPADSGGETNYGVTLRTARAAGYTGDMIDMTEAQATEIYKHYYWAPIQGPALAKRSKLIAEEVCDTAVNLGVKRSSEFLQRSLNVFNKRQTLYPDLIVDGDIGKVTIEAYEKLLDSHPLNESMLFKALNCLQGAFYIELAERREKDERFITGWIRNRV